MNLKNTFPKIVISLFVFLFVLMSSMPVFAVSHEDSGGGSSSSGSASSGAAGGSSSGTQSSQIKFPGTFDVKKYLRVNTGDEETDQGGAESQNLSDDPEVSPIFAFISKTIDFLIAVIGSLALLIFIVGAFYMLVSEGQEDRLQKGKQAMVFSLIGLALALFSYIITRAVQSIFF